jgi:hypothetical protein
MTLQQAVKLIEYFIQWRQGNVTPMPNPQEVTKALKIILKHITQ